MELFDFSILRDLRKKANLNIADVSAESGVAASVISKLERNRTRAELDTLYRLARVFGITAAELLNLAEARISHPLKAMLSTGHKRIRKAVSLPHLRLRSDLEPFPSIMRTEPYMFSQRSSLHTQVNLTLSILRKNSSVFLAPDSEFQGLLLLCHFLASA